MELRYYLGGGICLLLLWLGWIGLYLGVSGYPNVVLITAVILGIATVISALLLGWVLLQTVQPEDPPPVQSGQPKAKSRPTLIPFSYMTLGEKYAEYEDI